MLIVVFFLFLLISIIGIAVSRTKGLAHEQEHGVLTRINEEFRTLVVNSTVPNLRFDGRASEIVDEQQEHHTDGETNASTLVRVQRFAKNEYGEYFFFISEGNGRPFFKHVSQTNARLALGKKYVAPAPSIQG